MLALLDLDIVVYRAGFGSEKTIYTIEQLCNGEWLPMRELEMGTTRPAAKLALKTWQQEMPGEYRLSTEIRPLPTEYAEAVTNNIIVEALEAVNTTRFRGFLTANDGTNFRFRVAKTKPYKGNRKTFKKPIHYDFIRDLLINNWGATVISGMEADDALSIEQRKHLRFDDDEYICNSVIISIDKDMRQVPGYHFNMKNKTFEFVTPFEGLRNLYTQVLTGDNADNIPGLDGVGKITAAKLLKDATTESQLREIVKKEYLKHGVSNRFEEVYTLCKLLEKAL